MKAGSCYFHLRTDTSQIIQTLLCGGGGGGVANHSSNDGVVWEGDRRSNFTFLLFSLRALTCAEGVGFHENLLQVYFC